MTEVHIHFAAVTEEDPSSAGASFGVECDLSAEETAKANRFRFERDRTLYVTAHRFLRRTLASYLGCEPPAIEFVAAEHGKPELADRRLRFNLSHARGLVMVGVAESADLGVDVESIERSIDIHEVAPLVFNPRERAAWRGERATFFRTWTLKESYAKARGFGLSLDLQSFGFEPACPPRMVCAPSFDDPASWQFAELTPKSRHRAAAAVRAAEVRWVVHDLEGTTSESGWAEQLPPPGVTAHPSRSQ